LQNALLFSPILNIVAFFLVLGSSTEYFAKWGGDNRTICHPMWPCDWKVAVSLFSKDDMIQLVDSRIESSEQLEIFANMTNYALKIGGGIAGNNIIVDGVNSSLNERDFYLEISPFNESVLFGFIFVNFNSPILSVRGMDIFMMVNCSFENNSLEYDFPMMSFSNVTVILANSSIYNNSVEGTSLIGMNTAILGVFNSTISFNIQKSRGTIPLIEFTNAAAEINNSTVMYNVVPNSPLFGSWFFIVVILMNSTMSNNFCGTSALIVGDSLANITMDGSLVENNRGALLHSMTMSSLNITNSIINNNYAFGQSLIFAPRSSIKFLNQTIVSNNIAESITSSQLSNESSLHLISTVFINNSCQATAFALTHSESTVNNASLLDNHISNGPFLSIQTSNFSINNTIFNGNWIVDEGVLLFLEDTSIDVNSSKFIDNIGTNSGVFEVSIISNSTRHYIFEHVSFRNNRGLLSKSVYFLNTIPETRFSYCNFSSNRFEEVNGDLGHDILFHRCRFKEEKNDRYILIEDNTINGDDVFYITFFSYIISSILIVYGIIYIRSISESLN